jgi:hypothetical protein
VIYILDPFQAEADHADMCSREKASIPPPTRGELQQTSVRCRR